MPTRCFLHPTDLKPSEGSSFPCPLQIVHLLLPLLFQRIRLPIQLRLLILLILPMILMIPMILIRVQQRDHRLRHLGHLHLLLRQVQCINSNLQHMYQLFHSNSEICNLLLSRTLLRFTFFLSFHAPCPGRRTTTRFRKPTVSSNQIFIVERFFDFLKIQEHK